MFVDLLKNRKENKLNSKRHPADQVIIEIRNKTHISQVIETEC